MEDSFYDGRKWIWIVNIIVYIAVITTFCLVDGHELIYTLYLPLDFLLNLSKALFYWTLYYMEKRKKDKEEKLKQALQSNIQKNIKNALFAKMSGKTAPSSEEGLTKAEI